MNITLKCIYAVQIYKKEVLWKHILEIVNQTNLTDYTMDIRQRLDLGTVVPDELAARKAKVLATLNELQNEVAPITYATEKLKDTDHMKDSKTFLSILQKEYDVGVNIWYQVQLNIVFVFLVNRKSSSRTNGSTVPTKWANTCTSAAATSSRFRTCTFVCWSCSPAIPTI